MLARKLAVSEPIVLATVSGRLRQVRKPGASEQGRPEAPLVAALPSNGPKNLPLLAAVVLLELLVAFPLLPPHP